MFNFLIKLLFIFLITFNTSTAHADINVDPTGVLLDIFDVQADALKETSDKTIKSLADNALANFENIYEIVDSEQNFGNIDFNDKQCLTKTVDLIYEHEALKATLGLTTALNDISKAAKLESDIKALFDLVGLVKNVKEASRELASLLKSNKKAYVVNNLLAFGGKRNIKNLENILASTKSAGYLNAADLIAKLIEISVSSPDEVLNEAYIRLVDLLKVEVANDYVENLKNGVWAKLVIQDFIVKKWRSSGIINDNNIRKFELIDIYEKSSDGIFFKTPTVIIGTAQNQYKLFSQAQVESFNYAIKISINNEFDLTEKILNTNSYEIILPDDIQKHSKYGIPSETIFLLDNHEIFSTYPNSVEGKENILNTNITKSLKFNLDSYTETKKNILFESIVTYPDGTTLKAYKWLDFKPIINNFKIVDLPEKWSSDDFNITTQFCGDDAHIATVYFKNTNQTGYGNSDYTLTNPIDLGDECRKYSITIDGWHIYNYTGGNIDVDLIVEVAGVKSITYKKWLVNTQDIDNDALLDQWEKKYFSNLNQIYTDDFDKDGWNNGYEFWHNTDPTKAGVAGIQYTKTFAPKPLSNGDLDYDCGGMSGTHWSHISVSECNLILDGNTTIVGDLTLYGTLDLKGHTLTVAGNILYNGGVLDINGGILTVAGNILHQAGFLNINGGTLKISGDYNQSIEGYAYSTGILQMTNATDKVIIDGSFTIDNYENDQPNQARFTAGVLEVKGNFTQRSSANPPTAYASSEWSDYNFIPSGTHKVILSGTGKQVVSFEDGGRSFFNILDIQNTSGLLEMPEILAKQFSYVGKVLKLPELRIARMDVTLDQDLQIELPKGKALELQNATLNLNKHTLSLTGNLLHSGGLLNVNGGTLKISGDYNQSIEGYAYSTGILQMTNATDKVIIDGSFTIDNYENDQPNQARFTAGVLEVKGNFTQRSSANPSTAYASEWSDYNFIPSGTHKVILSGTGKQVVSFEDGALSHFAQLWLTNKTGVYFATPVSVTTLFEHNRLPFALADAANSSFVDYDNDKVKDNLDPYPRDKTNTVPDSDGDGVKDDKDAFPNNPKEWLDTDQDGIGNNADKDDDNDGVLDSKDLFPLDKSESLDTDKDGIGNNKDTDDDNDGMPDDWETLYGLNPLINDAKTDKDKDGLVNGDEYRYKADPTKVDSDHDGEQDKAEVNIKRNPAVNESAILQIIDSFL